MTCSACGAEMNHHADRLVHPVTDDEVAGMTVALDGALERVFACPGCGRVGARRVRASSAVRRDGRP
jgi:transcription elongation factor Elf1